MCGTIKGVSAPAPNPEHLPDEAALEPVELIRQSGAVLRIGRLALAAGTGSYRVKSHMTRVGRALGLDKVQAHVTLTEITATSHRGPIFRTELTEVRTVGVNADRMSELEKLAGNLPEHTDVNDIDHELDRISTKPLLYGPIGNAVWTGVACAAFAFLNHGGPVECGAVFLAAAVGQAVRRSLLHKGVNQFGVTMLAAAVASLLYLTMVFGLGNAFDITGSHEAGYISAVLFLVPGFPLVTGALDLAKLDFSAGISRVSYAVMILVSASLAVWGVSSLAGVDPNAALAPVDMPSVAFFALRAAASFLGVLGFAVMFNSPWRMGLIAATIGMIANVGRLYMVDAGVIPQAAAAAAALAVGVFGAWTAPTVKVPRVTLSVPGVVVMVPGAMVYRAVNGFNGGDVTSAIENVVNAGLVIVAIVIGLAVARMLTDKGWTFER